jgi:hypothetical protein
LQIALDNAVKLDTLPRGQPEIALGEFIGQRVMDKILLGSLATTGQFAAHHKHIGAIVTPAHIAVVLLIDTVEFEKIFYVLIKVGSGFVQLDG